MASEEKEMRKKGVSTVVATVLLILISFLAIGVISSFIIPMIRGGLGQGQSCFEVRDYVRVAESADNCYDEENTTLMIERGADNIEIKGFSISIYSESTKSSRAFEIGASSSTEGVMMYDSSADSFTLQPTIPLRGEGKTFQFAISNGTRAEIGVLTKDGSICQSSSSEIRECRSF